MRRSGLVGAFRSYAVHPLGVNRMSVEPAVNQSSTRATHRWHTIPRDLAERIVKLALDRNLDERLRVHHAGENTAPRYARLAVLHERQSRWWGVLLRHCDPTGPYQFAIIEARSEANRTARFYRDAAVRAAEQECAVLGEHDWDTDDAQPCPCGGSHPLRICARCLMTDETGCEGLS